MTHTTSGPPVVEQDQFCAVCRLFKESHSKIRILWPIKLNSNDRRQEIKTDIIINKEMKNDDNRRLHDRSCCLFKLVS